MLGELATFLLEAAGVSLSGVLAPGPVTAATLAAGLRRPHAGAWIAVGHGVVELPLMVLIVLGADRVLKLPAFQAGVGLAGGAMLLAMAALILAGLRRRRAGPENRDAPHFPPPPPSRKGARDAAVPGRNGPLLTGILLTGGNPYFLLWWATVGLALSTRAIGLGVLAFVLFAAVHWLCDLVWLWALSVAAHRGVGLLGPRTRRILGLVCAVAMAAFGVKFLVGALAG